ncbi:MAG: adenine-specific methylase [Anaerocolumna sp.]|nr:adenine-specific methylase [Anaerocolumna sp.]
MNKQKLLTTKEAAITLEVSESTIRRWTDSGCLICERAGQSKYRKFKLEDVERAKKEMYSNGVNLSKSANINNSKSVINSDIPPLPHPAHYLMHRYWGRKAHNVVSEYINFYTNEGDTVLDPFMGSGIAVIESLKSNRRAIGIDINPMSVFIVNNSLSRINLTEFEDIFNTIYNDTYTKYSSIYETHCPKCSCISSLEIGVWDNGSLTRVRGICEKHGTFIKDADDFDIEVLSFCKAQFSELDSIGYLDYPKDPIMQYVKRSGRERIDELFTERALIILSYLKKRIFQVENVSIRNLLLMCFTSMLPNVSRMLPADVNKCTYKSGWVISKFWTPAVHTERNIFACFKLRFKTVLKGKKELESLDPELATIYNCDSSNLAQIDDNSIDYIFTDPPYGESIAYLALSHFWNSWLKSDVDYESEIIIDSNRDKLYDDYDVRIKRAYSEMFRVLKPNHYLSFTFQNRDLNIWKSILEGCLESGFELVNIVMQSQAVSSGTQGINKKNTLTGDFVYNFIKSVEKPLFDKFEYLSNAESFIIQTITEYLIKNNGANSSELYEFIIPIIAKKHAYCDEKGKVINIESLIKKNFDYIETNKSDGKGYGVEYKWVVK